MKCSIVLLTRGHEYVEICSNSMLYDLHSAGKHSEYRALVEKELDFHEGNVFRRLFLSGHTNDAIIPKAVVLLVSDEKGNIVGLFRPCIRDNVFSVYYFDCTSASFWLYITGEDTVIRDTGIIKTKTGFRFTRGHLMLFPIFVSERSNENCIIDTCLVLINLITRQVTVLSNLRNEGNVLKIFSKLRDVEDKIINAHFRHDNSLCIVLSDSCFIDNPVYMYPDSGHLGVGIIANVAVQLRSFALDSFEVDNYLHHGFVLCKTCPDKSDLVIPDFDFPLSLGLPDSTNFARVFINRASELGIVYASFVQPEVKLFLASDSKCSFMLNAQRVRKFSLDFIRRDKLVLFENWNVEEPIIPKVDTSAVYRRLISLSMMDKLRLDINGDIRCLDLCQVNFVTGSIRGTVGYLRAASCDIDMDFSVTRFGELYLYSGALHSLKNLRVMHNIILQSCLILASDDADCSLDLGNSCYNVVNLNSLKGYSVLVGNGARIKSLIKLSHNTVLKGKFMAEKSRFAEGINEASAFTLVKPCSISVDTRLTSIPRLTIKGLARSQFGDYGLSLALSSQLYDGLIALATSSHAGYWTLDLLDMIPDETGHINIMLNIAGSAALTDCESARVMTILSILCLLSTMKLKVKSGIIVSFTLNLPLSLLSQLSDDSDCSLVQSVKGSNTAQSEVSVDMRADNALDLLLSFAGFNFDIPYAMTSFYTEYNTSASTIKLLLTKCASNLDSNGVLPKITCIRNSKKLRFSDEVYNFYTNIPTQYCVD